MVVWERAFIPGQIAGVRAFDFDYVRAEVSEQSGREGRRNAFAKFDYAQAIKRFVVRVKVPWEPYDSCRKDAG